MSLHSSDPPSSSCKSYYCHNFRGQKRTVNNNEKYGKNVGLQTLSYKILMSRRLLKKPLQLAAEARETKKRQTSKV